jgi:MinD-like ATPase involved in chromosome partitioning or flagellar assembly
VLLVDANFSAPNVGLYLGVSGDSGVHEVLEGESLTNAVVETHGFDVLTASLDYSGNAEITKLKKTLEKHKPKYDFIILDSSPNYEELKPVITAANRVFLVTGPDEVTLTTTLKAAAMARQQRTPVEGIVVNKIRSPKHEYDLQEIEARSEIPVLARVKDHVGMARANSERTPLVILDPNHAISKEIVRLASALCGEPEPTGRFSSFFSFKNFLPKEQVNRELARQKFYETTL